MRRNWQRFLTEGLIAGFIGFITVIVFVATADLLRGRSPFHTAAMLGSVIFFGLRDPAQLVVWPGPVLAYNGVHLSLFLLLGTFMAWLASLAERRPRMWYFALIIFLIVVPHVVGFPIWFGPAVGTAISVWVVGLATGAAAVAMAAYLWWAHPRIRQKIDAVEG